MGTDTSSDQPGVERDISVVRRAFEVTLAVLLGVVTLPALLIVLVASAVSFRTNPFFMHERIGLGGTSFRMRKVRTLPPSTSRYAGKRDLASVRVPRVMRLIRKLHLDELPQLWNVIRGDMNFIGPRPEMRFLHERLPADFAQKRTSVHPGVTGLWQVSTASGGMIGDSPEYDLFYLENRRLGLDVWIGLQTIRKVLFGHTIAYTDLRRPVDAPAEPRVENLMVGQPD